MAVPVRSRVRIESPDGISRTTRVWIDEVEISRYVQSVAWSVSAQDGDPAVADVRLVLPAVQFEGELGADSSLVLLKRLVDTEQVALEVQDV